MWIIIQIIVWYFCRNPLSQLVIESYHHTSLMHTRTQPHDLTVLWKRKVNVKSCNAQIDESLPCNMSLSTECAAALPSFCCAASVAAVHNLNIKERYKNLRFCHGFLASLSARTWQTYDPLHCHLIFEFRRQFRWMPVHDYDFIAMLSRYMSSIGWYQVCLEQVTLFGKYMSMNRLIMWSRPK